MDEINFNSKGKNYFAAANSGYGFYSFYDNIFEDNSIVQRFIIKGGPGTGKSRFMKEIAYAARKKGYDLETFCCSSDPSSLDGVIVDVPGKGRICVLDGTAPHVCEASLPGARDTIINFCDFWDAGALRGQKEKIRSLNSEKHIAYVSATDCLRSLLLLSNGAETRVHSGLDREKIRISAKKFYNSFNSQVKSGEYYERIGLASSFGMFGEYVLSTYTSVADSVIVVDNTLSVADAFIDEVLYEARERRISSWRSVSFLDPHRLDAIYLPDFGLSFVSSDLVADTNSEKIKKQISMQRFVDKSLRTPAKCELRELANAKKEIRKRAEAYMNKMRVAHFEIESIYVSCMNFDRKEAFCAEWIEENL